MPHFVIIHSDGKVEDYSLDANKSPSITTYPQFPKSGRDACALYYSKSMKVLLKPKTSKELVEWNFDDQAPLFTKSETWDNDENSRTKGLCATSSTGKLFIYSGRMDSRAVSQCLFDELKTFPKIDLVHSNLKSLCLES